MNVNGLPAGTKQILTQAGTAFRQDYPLNFSAPVSSDGISLVQAKLTGSFEPYEYDALSTNVAGLQATIQASSNTLIVTLPVPRQVRRITLASSIPNLSTYEIEIFRVDGNKAVGEAVITADNGSFVRADFTVASFAIRISNDGGKTFGKLKGSDLVGLLLRSYPTTPRLGLVTKPAPNQPEATNFFWQQAGEVGRVAPKTRDQIFINETAGVKVGLVNSTPNFVINNSALNNNISGGGFENKIITTAADELSFTKQFDPAGDFSPLVVDASTALAKALTQYFNTNPQVGSVSLVVEAEGPCVFKIAQVVLSYHLQRTTLPSGLQKQVLRFSKDLISSQTLSINLPGGVNVTSASVELLPSMGPGGAFESAGNELDSPDGVYLGTERWAGQFITTASTDPVRGLVFPLLGVTKNIQLLAELQEDFNGFPSGKSLATGNLKGPAAGERAWVKFNFKTPLTLPHTCWLLLKTTQGQAVWFAQPISGANIGLFERPDQRAAWQKTSNVPGLTGFFQFLAAGTQAGSPLSLSLAGQQINLSPGNTPNQSDFLTFEFSGPLNVFLGTLPSGVDTLVPLVFTSSEGGLATVYAPKILYDA